MTANQMAYLNLMESQRKRAGEISEERRSNLAKEAETQRSNLAKEAETRRSNVSKEAENMRANSMKEAIEIGKLSLESTPKWAREFGIGGFTTIAPTIKSTAQDVARGREIQNKDNNPGFMNAK